MDALLAAFALEAKEVASVKVEEDTRPSPRSCACLVACTLKVIGIMSENSRMREAFRTVAS